MPRSSVPRSSGENCRGRSLWELNPMAFFLPLTACPSSHLPGDPCPRLVLRSAPHTGLHSPRTGLRAGHASSTTVYPSLQTEYLPHEWKKSPVCGQSQPRNIMHWAARASLLMQLLLEPLRGGRQGPGVVLHMGPLVGPDTGRNLSLSATMHSLRPKREGSPKQGWPEGRANCPSHLL